MADKSKLYILWTNPDPITAEKMVFMYAKNSRLQGWWDDVTVIIWGATAKLAAEDHAIQNGIAELKENGVHVSACKACADQLNVAEKLDRQGIEVQYWGESLTRILKDGEKLLTI